MRQPATRADFDAVLAGALEIDGALQVELGARRALLMSRTGAAEHGTPSTGGAFDTPQHGSRHASLGRRRSTQLEI